MIQKQAKINSAGQTKSVTPKKKLQGAAREVETVSPLRETAKERESKKQRYQSLKNILLSKRQEIMKEIRKNVGQSLAEARQPRLKSVGDMGDQAVMDLECERDIFLMEMRNRRRQSLDEALVRLREGTYGICVDCGFDINHKRLQAVPFAKLCAECLSHAELLETSELVLDRIGLGFTAIASKTGSGLNKSPAKKLPVRMI